MILHIRNSKIIAYRASAATPPHIKVNKTIPSCAIAYESPKIPDPRIAFIKLNTDNANPAFPVPFNKISFYFHNSDLSLTRPWLVAKRIVIMKKSLSF